MRYLRPALFVCLASPAAFAQYTYDRTDTLTSVDTAHWYQNGTVTPTSYGATSAYNVYANGGGSLISKDVVPGNANLYEVRATLKLSNTSGVYTIYLNATNDALNGPTTQGSYYAIEFTNTGQSNGTITLYKRIGGVLSTITSGTVLTAKDGMQIRAVRGSGFIAVYWNGYGYLWAQSDPALTTGQPGIGVRQTPDQSSISKVEIGHLDTVAPAQPPVPAVTALPNEIQVQWGNSTDDSVGTGVRFYRIDRNGTVVQYTNTPEFTDATVASGTSYSYTIYTLDWHQNFSPSRTFTAATPSTGVNPRRVGVRALGNYWGDMGENIDLASGNLSYTLPLLTAVGRAGLSLPVALTYNSQLWRQDAAGVWKLGVDSGQGFGWRVMAGSLTPFWSDLFTLHHWLFTDSTGAEYRLDVNTSGVWTSKESVYVRYDGNANRLFFRDGSSWLMGSQSGATEADAGTRYPTRVYDTNGNYIRLFYQAAVQTGVSDTSSRLVEIEDVRAVNVGTYQSPAWRTYAFNYVTAGTTALPHLFGISDLIGTSEKYSFWYGVDFPLTAPFNAQSFGTTWRLFRVTSTVTNLDTAFDYNGDSYELTQVAFPHGATLGWTHQSVAINGMTHREVASRSLYVPRSRAILGDGTDTHTLSRPGDATTSGLHSVMQIADPSGVGVKKWLLRTDAPFTGLLSQLDESATASGAVLRRVAIDWVQHSSGNAYVGAMVTKHDVGQAYERWQRVEQAIDQHGNITVVKKWPWNDYTQANARTWSYSYYGAGTVNRLLSASIIVNGTTTQLVQNGFGNVSSPYGGPVDPPPPGDSVNSLRQYDASMASNPTGNLASSTSFAKTTYWYRNYTGDVTATGDGQGHYATNQSAAATNYAAPSVITPNGVSSLGVSATYNSFLAITGQSLPNGASTGATYDTNGRITSTTAAVGATTAYTYNDAAHQSTAATSTRWTRTTVDGLGRTILAETGTGTTVVSRVRSEYAPCACSPMGKLKRTTTPYTPLGNGADPSTLYWTTYTYDGLGRTIVVAQPNNRGTSTTSYAGDTTTVTDPAARWKKQTMDAWGNLVQLTEPNPKGGADLITTYTYDVYGKMLTAVMTRTGTNNVTTTQTRTWVYDAATQRLASATLPETGTTTYTYNADGSLATKTDARQMRGTYTYDTLGRVTRIDRAPVAPATGVTDYDQFEYEASTFYATWGQNLAGRLASATYMNGEIGEHYSYSPAGLVIGKRLTVFRNVFPNTGPNPFQTSGTAPMLEANWTYDSEGKVLTTTYPTTGVPAVSGPAPATTQAGPVYQMAYDSLARPLSLTETTSNTTIASIATYGPMNQLLSLSYLGRNETRTYDELGQLTGIAVPGVISRTYAYSATQNDGKITSMTDALLGETVNYTYDGLGRLTAAGATNQVWGLAWDYDGFGNRLSQTVTAGSAPMSLTPTDPATNRLNGQVYDIAGNQLTTPTLTGLTYDGASRLLQATVINGPTENYAYDPRNRRAWRKSATAAWSQTPGTVDTGEALTFWGANGQKLGDYNLQAVQEQLNGPLRLIIATNRIRVYWADKLVQEGGQVVTLDRSGSLAQSGQRTFPYGEESSATTHDRTKFATYTRDSQTELDYAEQRYYVFGIGRFATPDPTTDNVDISSSASWNSYNYADSDPVNGNDPDGLSCKDSKLFGFYDLPDGITVGNLFSGNTAIAVFAKTIFAEGRVASDDAAEYEKAAIASVIMNRWQFVNGTYDLYDNSVGLPGADKVRISPDWGIPDKTISSIVYARGQFAVWESPGVLERSSQDRFSRALNSTEASEDCRSLIQSIGTAAAFWSARTKQLLYTGEYDFVFTSFGSGGRNQSYYEQVIGSYGSGNEFYGVRLSQVWRSGVDVPKPEVPERPRRPKEPPKRRKHA